MVLTAASGAEWQIKPLHTQFENKERTGGREKEERRGGRQKEEKRGGRQKEERDEGSVSLEEEVRLTGPANKAVVNITAYYTQQALNNIMNYPYLLLSMTHPQHCLLEAVMSPYLALFEVDGEGGGRSEFQIIIM